MLAAEAVVDSAIATLKAALPAQLALVNLPGADPIPVLADEDYYLGMQQTITRYPAIEVACASERIGNFTVGLRAGDAGVPAYVVCWAEHPDHEQLARQVYRLSTACARSLVVDSAFGEDTLVVQVDVTYVGQQPETANPPLYRGAAIMAFQLSVIETVP